MIDRKVYFSLQFKHAFNKEKALLGAGTLSKYCENFHDFFKGLVAMVIRAVSVQNAAHIRHLCPHTG